MTSLPIHGRVVHEGAISLQVELAECQNTQGNKGHREDQAQKGVGCTAALRDAGKQEMGRLSSLSAVQTS